VKLVANIAVNLIAFVALLDFVNATLVWFGDRVGMDDPKLTFQVHNIQSLPEMMTTTTTTTTMMMMMMIATTTTSTTTTMMMLMMITTTTKTMTTTTLSLFLSN
jgi:hypothetical protein